VVSIEPLPDGGEAWRVLLEKRGARSEVLP
jgi:hypothetical protein